jgi:hypothetical protein
MELRTLTVPELLTTHGAIIEELRRREIVRSANNPISDLAELLFCRAFGWRRENSSAASFDARDAAGIRYQIKGRRFTPHNASRKLSARNLPDNPFDILAGVIFNPDYGVHRAALVPFAVVSERATYGAHTNSWRFFLRDEVWAAPKVIDATDALRAAEASL